MDIEDLVLRVVRDAVAHRRYRMPMRTAAVGANGAVLFSEFTAPPFGAAKGSIAQTHVTGQIPDEGFGAPVHVMITDATGRATVAMFRGGGDPLWLDEQPLG